MKTWKRLVAFALVLVLLFADNCLLCCGDVAAHAEVGSVEVPQVPDRLLKSGEWRYWLEDDLAIIAGYGNAREKSLKIPFKLNGYAVVGIGHNAFADMRALQSVELHSNVIRIAADAFGTLPSVAIEAYNGSYALRYAQQYGVTAVNLSEQSNYTLRENAIDMRGVPDTCYTIVSDEEITIRSDCRFFQVGDVLCFSAQPGYPDGLAGRISKMVSGSNGEVRVALAEVNLAEIISEYYGSEDVFLDYNHAVFSEGVTCSGDISAAISGSLSFFNGEGEITFGIKTDSVEGTGSFKIGPIKINYNVGFENLFKPKVDADITVPTKFTIKASTKLWKSGITQTSSLSPDAGLQNSGKDKKLLAYIPFLNTGIVSGGVKVYYVSEFKGGFSLSVSFESSTTTTYRNNKRLEPVVTRHYSYEQLELTGTLKKGVEAELSILLGFQAFGKKVGVEILNGTFGLFFVAEGKLSLKSLFTNPGMGLNGDNGMILCGNIEFSAKVELSGKIGAIQIQLVDEEKDLPPSLCAGLNFEQKFPIFNLHVDNGKFVKTCILEDRLIRYEFDDTGHTTMHADVGDYIPTPVVPPSYRSKKGYRDDGWYISKSASGLSGKDEKVDFSTMRMPCLGTNGILVLYKKWTPLDPKYPPIPYNHGNAVKDDSREIGGGGSGGGSGGGGVVVTPAPTPSPTPTPPPPPVPVSSITLDITSAEYYKGEEPGILQLHATVLPEDATNKDIAWVSSNDSVAYVDQNGLVTIGNSGEAEISCYSVLDGHIQATCVVKVKQHVERVFIEAEESAMIPGETLQLSAVCLPDNAENKAVTWYSSNTALASVDSTGLVTGKKYGEVLITAAAQDGSGMLGTYRVKIEHELEIEASVLNDVLYLQGTADCPVAVVAPTSRAAKLMDAHGYTLQWAMSAANQNTVDRLDTIELIGVHKNGEFQSTLALISCEKLVRQGSQKLSVTCKAGPYTASVEFSYSVSNSSFAEGLALHSTSFYTDVDNELLLPNTPLSTDTKPVPAGLSMDISSNRYWRSVVDERDSSDGICVTFRESGIFEAELVYSKGNLVYRVPVTFYVRDIMGIVHVPVREITLNHTVLNLVEGDTYQLACELSPVDAYDKAVRWISEDESVVTVDEHGVVTALRPGTACVYCEAQDGSGSFALCAVHVEAFLQLDESELAFTVYTEGEQSAVLETVNVTLPSEQRLTEAGLDVSWSLERVLGSAVVIAVEEYTSIGKNGIAVSGNRLQLVRILGTGSDVFRLTCKAGAYSESCVIRITAVDTPLPSGLVLTRTQYRGKTEEGIVIDTTPVCSPADIPLPSDAVLSIDGTLAYRRALSGAYSFIEQDKLIFSRAGTYQAELVYAGANYAYRCPIVIEVEDDEGNTPPVIENVRIQRDSLTLLTGESFHLEGGITPADAPHSVWNWSSYDTSVATVSADGVVTALEPGVTVIVLSVPESDLTAFCVVTVEDGLTLERDSLEYTVFVDGLTRVRLDTLMLSEASSLRLENEPEWSLERVSGNNLTLRVSETEQRSEDGETLYGCELCLYSVSRPGDTIYRLSAVADGQTATASITVHAVEKSGTLPAGLELAQTVYEAEVDELIAIHTQPLCWPEDTSLPDGTMTFMNRDLRFTQALNQADYHVSQSLVTLSFREPGIHEANLVYTYSNVQYLIPLRFRIRDNGGSVPVLAQKLQLSRSNVYLVKGETITLEAVFVPADTSDQTVSWTSSNPAVVQVSENGTITALKNGTAIIRCRPNDPHVRTASCSVTVEDYLTVQTGALEQTLYLQGTQENELSAAWLSKGTVERLKRDELTACWELIPDGVTNAALAENVSEDGTMLRLHTSALLSVGDCRYTLRCSVPDASWEQTYTLHVNDCGVNAPEALTLQSAAVKLGVGETAHIDFTPLCFPEGSSLPDGMNARYIGLGGFYDALKDEVYEENGDWVTLAFTHAGRYVLTRQYRLANLHYTLACTIEVGAQSAAGYGLLCADETDCVVYATGESGVAAVVSLTDAMIAQEWGESLQWRTERLSGSSLTVSVKPDGNRAKLYVANVKTAGTDLWRVSCLFGGIEDSVEIQLTAREPRAALPEAISIRKDHLHATTGDWLTIPLGVVCSPSGSALPDSGDAFWRFEMDGSGADVTDCEINHGILYLNFAQSGYYTGRLRYQSGNVRYALPLYFVVSDEEGVVSAPDMKLFVTNAVETVYPEGETGVVIGKAVMRESLNSYAAGTALAYMENQDAVWSVRILEGDAARLTLRHSSAADCDILLTQLCGTGTVRYEVSCLAGGKACTKTGTLYVASEQDERPDATLVHTSYAAVVDQELEIDPCLYARQDGRKLSDAVSWENESLLPAIGYGYEDADGIWRVTFYEQGVYESTVSGYAGNLRISVPLTVTVRAEDEAVPVRVLLLPKELTELEDEAFVGISVDVVDLRGTKIRAIGERAFKNCVDLQAVYLPGGELTIGTDAFYGCLNLTIYCERGSQAEEYARRCGLPIIYLE